MSKMQPNSMSIEDKLDYHFNNKAILQQALTHRSFVNECHLANTEHNERLEFLGDAVLELMISDYIFNRYPELSEGEMTKLRAGLVCEPMLAKTALQLQLGQFLQLGKGEEQTGGRTKDSLLADAFEAMIGAIYLDGGHESAKTFVLNHLKEEARQMVPHIGSFDAKTELQTFLQKTSTTPLVYHVTGETGPEHDKSFIVEVSHMGKKLGTGKGRSKKEAEQGAASQALNLLVNQRK